MLSQWQYFLKNLGEWHGSFTRISPEGEEIEDTPTIVAFTSSNNNQSVKQLVRRLPPNQPPQDKCFEYKSFGRNILFFENGAFSIGATTFNNFSPLWAELGLIYGERRLRLVQIFSQNNSIDRLTLIREKLPDSKVDQRPKLTWEKLLGEWQGEATTLFCDLRNPEHCKTYLKVSKQSNNQLLQELSFSIGSSIQNIKSVARIDGSILHFETGKTARRILLLPDGTSANFPLEVKLGEPFFLELGWLLDNNHRQRMIRSYSSQGEWVSLTLVEEYKVA